MVGKLGVRLTKENVGKFGAIHRSSSSGVHGVDGTEEVVKEGTLQGTTSTPEEEQPFIPCTGARRRTDQPRYVPTDWDDTLPYGGKVYLARRKKPDTWLCIGIQIVALAFAIGLLYYGWFHTEYMHFHVTKIYAHFGHINAQALVGHKYLHGGADIEQNHTAAMHWLKKAADQGHPHAAYNIAVGHMQGLHAGLEKGEARRLIQHAADNGVPEAVDVMERLCSRGHCDT